MPPWRAPRLLAVGACVVGVLAPLAILAPLAGCADGHEQPAGDAGVDPDALTTTDVRPPAEGGLRKDASSGDDGGVCTRKVVINELMPEGPSNAEFVELYNPNACALSLGGWRLRYRASNNNPGVGSVYTFEPGASIPARSFLLLGNENFVGKKDGTMTANLGNQGGQLGLVDETDAVIDAIGYGAATAGDYTEKAPAPLPGPSASLARKSDGVDTDDNAADFAVATTNTAGVGN